MAEKVPGYGELVSAIDEFKDQYKAGMPTLSCCNTDTGRRLPEGTKDAALRHRE